ncbi:MarR family winged helix-turn-helix transcriptional regulator [Pseudomonas azerbaijanoccidens]|jgi:DNA-binding MarR family transcriptional regulator|uniref:MarR family winged helix-turn-helix transcriptional regulator n=1 Tax=Pseudomonas azerbaijanoccidentalis TaxID=2842347 RepID=UPI00200A3454|nr:MarR family winged helix-turn-helix transcriptional regulator [Pseudomonas azerbaijanoccidentalis]MCK8663413.1 MarR family winged helix-turn-helix transcriptional regulator [Pseudomonas azerbaijanoccidentalis]
MLSNLSSSFESVVSETPDSSYVFSEQVGHLLRKAYQRHMAIFQQNVGDSQLTAVQFVTLCAVRDHGPSSLTELVKATAVDQATIRGIVERLKARELITLEPDPEDRRKVIVGLSADGDRLVQQTVPCAARISELTMSNLNPAEQVAVLFLLRKMIDDPQD